MDLLLAEKRRIGTIYFLMSEDNVKLQLQQPWMKFGTDAGGIGSRQRDGASRTRARTAPTRASSASTCATSSVIPLEDACAR